MISMQQADRIPIWKNKQLFLSILICACGVVINLAGAKLAGILSVPLFLDAIGTIVAASLGGYIPGIAVGFITNIINSLSDYSSAYYGVLNVLIAIAAAFFAQRKADKKVSGILLSVLVYALIGGALGSVLTWFLYGMDFGTGISAPLAHTLYDQGVNSVFWAQLIADCLIDLLDKAVSVAIAIGILWLVPRRFKESFSFYREREARSARPKRTLKSLFSGSLSLGTKIMLLISSAVLLLGIVVTFICFQQFHDAALETQVNLSVSMAKMASSYIDGNRVPDYLAQGEEAEGYLDTKRDLERMLYSSNELEFLYVYKILPDGCHVVFDLDTEDLKGEPPGTLIEFDDAFADYLPALLAGEEIKPVISDETYGWLLTAYQPVYDDNGQCQCYAAVDLSMPRIITDEQVFMTRIGSLFMSFFILLTAVGLTLARNRLVKPINSMAHAAGNFAYNSQEARSESVDSIRQLNIRSGDEIENLYHALVATTEETVSYIADSQEKNEKIRKMQNGLILVLADLVESRDQCTGDHVRKTAAYTGIIMAQMRKDGVHTDILTDDYMRDVVTSAPLHDVGKIHVPDAILNKPGKLTEEEFAIMKEHSTVGGEIIQYAINTVSGGDSGYLKEARNLAMYHHERWDGKGYPSGLKGEDIPLSARVMAVADVFDALVSKRSYKNGFPFDKAMNIILEESGTHFDPQVVNAFYAARDEVRRVEESYSHS